MSDEEGDDDWFEEALKEGADAPDTGADGDDDGDNPFGGDDDGDDSPFGGDSGTDGDEESPFAGDETGDNPFGGGDGSDEDSFGGDGADDSPFGGGDSDADSGSPFGDDDGSDDSPFDGDDDGSSDSPFGGGGDDDGSDDSPFGGGDDDGGGGSPFGDAGGDGGDDLFEDDFSAEFGGGGGGGGGESEFDDEEFDDEERLKLGIKGLDNMIRNGVPRRHLMVVIGSAGTGKTTFGLKFLQHGLQKDDPEKAVFITLEQSQQAIMDTAAERDWEFERHEAEDNLAVIDLDPVEMANSLQNIRAELPHLIKDFGADRLVLDSVSLLEMMYNEQAKRRTEVFDFTRSLKQAGVTTMLTSEASSEYDYASRHGIIEYLTDAVFHLQYVRQENGDTRMAVEIQKIRNAIHSRETKPYEISDTGLDVYQQANIF